MIFSVVLILFICLMLLIGYLLFAPLMVEIDSNIERYRISIVPVFRLCWVTDEFPGHPEIIILGFKKKLNLSKWFSGKEVPDTELSVSRLKRKISFSRIIAVFNSFRIKQWLVNIDTGDMPLNGELFPLMDILSRMTGKQFYINFYSKNEVVITIENNAFRMLKAYIINH